MAIGTGVSALLATYILWKVLYSQIVSSEAVETQVKTSNSHMCCRWRVASQNGAGLIVC